MKTHLGHDARFHMTMCGLTWALATDGVIVIRHRVVDLNAYADCKRCVRAAVAKRRRKGKR